MIRYHTYLIPIHPYAYRHKGYENHGMITGVYEIKPSVEADYRFCYQVCYPDGFKDQVPISEVECGNYKIVGINEIR